MIRSLCSPRRVVYLLTRRVVYLLKKDHVLCNQLSLTLAAAL